MVSSMRQRDEVLPCIQLQSLCLIITWPFCFAQKTPNGKNGESEDQHLFETFKDFSIQACVGHYMGGVIGSTNSQTLLFPCAFILAPESILFLALWSFKNYHKIVLPPENLVYSLRIYFGLHLG